MRRHTPTHNSWAFVLLAVLGVLAVWAWMKGYRAWEANRRIFLYPENWLEPELRGDKSGLFKELEGELLDSEVTQGKIEGGFLAHFRKHLRCAWPARA
ncbi:MAG TPA: neuraminidase-like domain-containing protein [Dermatophilaceae bacterium]